MHPRFSNILYSLIMMAIIINISCENKPTEVVDEPITLHILGVEYPSINIFESNSVTFRAIANENVILGEHQFNWIIEDTGGVYIERITDNNELIWIAPQDTGLYEHSVQIKN